MGTLTLISMSMKKKPLLNLDQRYLNVHYLLKQILMEFACLQHLDMIKLRLGFGEFDRISELLQKQYCTIKAKNFT